MMSDDSGSFRGLILHDDIDDEAHRALELLEEYHSKLTRYEDRPLREAIERVITIFKSRLFQALLDIQEFYEETLLNDAKSSSQKAYETNRLADTWEINPPILGGGRSTLIGNLGGLGGLGSGGATTILGNFGTGGLGTGGLQKQQQYSKTEKLSSSKEYHHISSSTGGGGPDKSPREFRETTSSKYHHVAASDNPQKSPRTIHESSSREHYVSSSGQPESKSPRTYRETTLSTPTPIGSVRIPVTIGTAPSPRTPVFERIPPTNGASRDEYKIGSLEKWDYEDIVLEKGTSGLGFSIAGGNDNPHIENDYHIYVTKIIPGGAAAYDGRLKKGDAILRVNTWDLIDVPHSDAVDALKRAGNVVKLYVRRPRGRIPSPERPISIGSAYQRVERIELSKGNKGLGFSIAGGFGNEHIPGDTAIYVTKIIDGGAAQMDGRMQVGDKLLAVGNQSLEGVTHETAVAALKATSDRVVLLISKTPHSVANEPHQRSFNDSFNEIGGGGGSVGHHMPESRSFQAIDQSPTRLRHNSYGALSQGGGTGIGTRPFRYDDVPQAPTAFGPPVVRSPSEIPRGPRSITLTKGPNGLGFNIVGGEDSEGIYISYVTPGGVADLSGDLHKGDQLLEVNHVNLRNATHEEAASALKNSGQRVTLAAQYRPEAYARFEAKISEFRDELINQGQQQQLPPHEPLPRRELYVRALFDYDPTKDSGLPSRGLAFNYGDILHVVNASDDDWWQARKVLQDGLEEGHGIVPSKKRVEKKERARRKQVNFGSSRQGSLSEKHSGSKKSLTLSRKFPFMKSKERVNDESDVERQEDVILSYEAVEQRALNYARPVVILGPLKDRINDELITEFPDRYGSCVPHTSRPRRDNERDGQDYYFVSREQMERDISNHLFIEAGQYNGNLYGTSIASVRNIADQGKHCILDVSGNAIKRLQTAGLFPIAVFVKPYTAGQLFEWNRRLTDDEADRQYQRALQIEQDFTEYFTAIVQGDSADDVYAKVKDVIREQSAPLVWVPSLDRL